MVEYRQWYTETETKIFTSEHIVSFSLCGKDKKLSLHELLRLTSDIAVEDFNQRNLSRDTLTEHGIAILVSRVSFRIHKYPVENQHITLVTWEEKNEPLQFIRSFEIKDTATGEKLISGLTTWLLVDLKSRRLMPVKLFTLRPPVEYVSEHDCLKPGKITAPENMTLLETRKVRSSDQDANGHTNNSRYAAFAIDALPQEYAHKEFTDIKVNFCQEALEGQDMEIWASFNDSGKVITVIGKCEGVTSFECELYY